MRWWLTGGKKEDEYKNDVDLVARMKTLPDIVMIIFSPDVVEIGVPDVTGIR